MTLDMTEELPQFVARPHGQLPLGGLELPGRTGCLGHVADDGALADGVAQDLVQDGVDVHDARGQETPSAGADWSSEA